MIKWLKKLFGIKETTTPPIEIKPVPTPVCNYNETDLEIVAKTCYMEARNQGIEGIIAVACVIANRWKVKGWWWKSFKIHTIKDICLAKYQFSCWNKGDQCDKIDWKNIEFSDSIYDLCYNLARKVLSGEIQDNTDGACYYLAEWLYKSPDCPSWAKKLYFIKQIGHHLFYKDN